MKNKKIWGIFIKRTVYSKYILLLENLNVPSVWYIPCLGSKEYLRFNFLLQQAYDDQST